MPRGRGLTYAELIGCGMRFRISGFECKARTFSSCGKHSCERTCITLLSNPTEGDRKPERQLAKQGRQPSKPRIKTVQIKPGELTDC